MKRILYILLVLTLTGCTAIEVRKTLKDVETYIAERPDSALAVIESMDTTDLTTKGLRAHHALLHAMALDKNYIDVTDDSLALKAVNYYQKRGPRKNYARALYYLALSYYYDKQYDKSIIELSKAEPVAEKNDSLYWGFAKVLQASVYSRNYNEIAELEALEEALQIYLKLDDEYYHIDATSDSVELGGKYHTIHRYFNLNDIIQELALYVQHCKIEKYFKDIMISNILNNKPTSKIALKKFVAEYYSNIKS